MKIWLIVLIIIGILILGYAFWPKPVFCTADCNTICDLEEECCYDMCVPGSCNGNGKDVGYYKERDYITPGENEQAIKFLAGEDSEWSWCEENLP
jgi:hypothetical protein